MLAKTAPRKKRQPTKTYLAKAQMKAFLNVKDQKSSIRTQQKEMVDGEREERSFSSDIRVCLE